MKNQKGITLIALVVTIIILLILASTTLAALLDDEGLSNQAVDLSKNVEKSSKENDKKIKDMADELDSIMNPEESPQIEVVQDGKTVWKGGKATIKLKVLDGGYPTDEYDILYKKTASTRGINRVWNTYKDSITGDNGDAILCYAIDSNSVAVSDTTSITILDKIAPKEATIILDTDMATGYSGSATISHTDNESGIKITACKWEINQISSLIGTEASKYSNSFTNDGEKIEISGDTAGAWYLHVLSVDNAGNARETVKKCRADVSKSPKVVINGETVTLTEDNFKYYIGKIVTNYKTTTEEVESLEILPEQLCEVSTQYRIYYVDFDNKYGDGEGTVYIIADGSPAGLSQITLPTTDTTSADSSNVKIKNLNPSLYATGVTAPDATNDNMKAVTWLTNTKKWEWLKSNINESVESKINYIVGAPSIEMMMDSYNTYYDLKGTAPDTSTLTETSERVKLFYQYPCTVDENNYGYAVGPSDKSANVNGYEYWTLAYSVKPDSLVGYMYSSIHSVSYLLASPSGYSSDALYAIIPNASGFFAPASISEKFGGVPMPIVSLKPSVKLELKD